jgi:hypothetical protein
VTPPADGTAVESPAPPTKGMRGRLSWAVADQAMSSLNSFLVGIPAAHQCGAAGFGVFSTAWVTYGVALAMSRGLSTDPLTVRYSGVAQATWRRATSAALATALAVGVVVGALCAVVGLALGGLLGHAMLALGVVLPGVLVQDAWRISFIAVGAGKKAFVNDLISCVVVVPLLFPAGRSGVSRLWSPPRRASSRRRSVRDPPPCGVGWGPTASSTRATCRRTSRRPGRCSC